MLNQIILIGRLTKDPERRGQNSEKPVAVIRLAVDRDFKRDGDPDADFFNCSVFGNQAKFVLEYGKIGIRQKGTFGVLGGPYAAARVD